MKKLKYLVLFSALVVSYNLYGQKGFYLGLNTGYGFSVGGGPGYDYSVTANGTSAPNVTYKSNLLNLGQGFSPCLQAGYFFNPNLGVELGIGYLFGNDYKTTSTNGSNNSYSYTSTVVYKLSSLYLIPSLIIKVPLGTINPYLKTGLFLGVLNQNNISNYYSGYYSDSYVTKQTGGLVFGVQASIGVEIMANKSLGIFGEFVFKYANYSPGSYTQTSTNVNTTNGNSTTTNYSGNYLADYSTSSSSPSSSSSKNIVQDRLLVSYAANALGLSVGVRYYLNQKKE